MFYNLRLSNWISRTAERQAKFWISIMKLSRNWDAARLGELRTQIDRINESAKQLDNA